MRRIPIAAALAIGLVGCDTPGRMDLTPIGGGWHFHLRSSGVMIEAGGRAADLYRDWDGKPLLVARDPEFYKYYESHNCMLWETAGTSHVVAAACGDRAPFVVAVDDYHRWTMDERGLVSEGDALVESGRAVRPTVIYELPRIVKASGYEKYFSEDKTADEAQDGSLRPEEINVPITAGSLNEAGRTPLMEAAERNALEVANALIKQGANINATDQGGTTALMVAADRGKVDVFKLLIDAGANIHLRDSHGRTALMMAAGALDHQVAMVTMLLDAGADKTLRDTYGNTALSAIRSNTDPQLRVLLALQ